MSETGTGSSIRRSGARAPRKPKPNQLPFALILLVLLVVGGLLLNKQGNGTAWFFVTGLIFGYILQRSRFCFTASMRDPYLTGGTQLTRAVLAAFAITTIGFAAIKYGYFSAGLPIPVRAMWCRSASRPSSAPSSSASAWSSRVVALPAR
jgi:hypothetical protein